MHKIHKQLFLTIAFATIAISSASAQTWEIGYKSMTFTDPSRSNRQIDANVFYPADVTGWDVPFGSPIEKRYPVVVFGHDEGTGFNHYAYIWNYLTVRGFIVITPLTEMSAVMDVEEFAKDLAFVAQSVKDGRLDPTSFFYQRYNNKSCLIGHGKGGSAAVLGVQHFPTVTTLVTLAANEVAPGVAAAATQITAPSVVVAGGEDCVSPLATVQEAIFNNLASDCKTLVHYTTVPRCPFAQNASSCTASQVTCGGPNPYSWQAVSNHTAYLLVSFMRYYMKSNAPALDKFEWKLQQKQTDFLYIMACNTSAPRVGWQPEDSDNEPDEELSSLLVNVYPNPSNAGNNARVIIETEFETTVAIRIVNMMGQVVYEEHVALNDQYNEVLLNTSNLKKGLYMLHIASESSRNSKHLIIN